MAAVRRVITSAVAASCMVAACVVPSVTLVDELPGRSGSGGSRAGAGGSSAASGNTGGRGGDQAAEGGAHAGGVSDGGTDVGGGGGHGGTDAAGSGGAGGSVVGGPFPAESVCASAQNVTFCEAFAPSGPTLSWTNLGPGSIESDTQEDTPSAPVFAQTRFAEASPGVAIPDDVKVSFWARYPAQTDQTIVGFGSGGRLPIRFGVEGDHFRFQHGTVVEAVVAPSASAKTTVAESNTWYCIEIIRSQDTLSARVIPFGEQAVQLPIIDGVGTVDEDLNWVAVIGNAYDWDGSWWFGDAGNNIAIDDVMASPVDGPSTCDYYLTQSAL